MLRFLIFFIVVPLFVRACWLFASGIHEGLDGRRPPTSRVPQRGVHMVRDPVCGTFVVPERAVALMVGGQQMYFCSTECRDKFGASNASQGFRERSTA